jgi:hypothetical protein
VPRENQENTLVMFRSSGGIAVQESQQRKETVVTVVLEPQMFFKIWVIGSVLEGTNPSQQLDPEKVHGG